MKNYKQVKQANPRRVYGSIQMIIWLLKGIYNNWIAHSGAINSIKYTYS